MKANPPQPSGHPLLFQSLFALIGVLFGLSLCGFGGSRLIDFANQRFPQKLGTFKAQLLSNRIERTRLGDLSYHATFELTIHNKTRRVSIRLSEDKSLYRYLHQQRWGKVYRVMLGKQRVSRRVTVTKVDNVVVGKKRKTNEGILFLGVLIMGAALVFAAIRRFLQQRHREPWRHLTQDP